ncbi:NAD-P-binding protein [Amylostereum chailletii]|nr:NAD-P-binding protein [Amylostereum chailletii]
MSLTPSLLPPRFLQTDLPYSRPPTPGVHDKVRVGWVGLGVMGHIMARNLALHPSSRPAVALPIVVWNRSKDKSEKLAKELGEGKIAVAQTLEEIATQCDVIITSLANDAAVISVYTQMTNALKAHPPTKTKIFVETSTVYPKVAGELDILISALPHGHFVTAPVFGPPAAAETSALIVCLSGDYRIKKEVAHILVPAVGRKVLDLGGNVEKGASFSGLGHEHGRIEMDGDGTAPTFKLIGNGMILGSMELVAEAYTVAEKAGIDQEIVYQYIKDMFPAPPMLNYGNKMLNRQFDGNKGFAIDNGIKDASHIHRLTTEVNAPMPVVDIALQHMLTARALHDAQARTGATDFPVLDWSALVAGTRVAAGLDPLRDDKASPLTATAKVEKDD